VQRYVLGRIGQTLITLLIVSVLVFILARLTGDPVDLMLPLDATLELRERTRQQLGLDKPIYVQYGLFLTGLAKGDLGTSIRHDRTVAELLAQRLPNTLQLVSLSIGLALAVAFPLGVMAAVKKGSLWDTGARTIALFGQSVPAFWAAIVLILVFGVQLDLLPVGRKEGLQSFVLPTVTMAFFSFMLPGVLRLLRSSMLEVLDAEFIRLARVKGVGEWVVIWKHALRNALIPVVTFVGFYFGILLSGSVVVEAVFAWPGIGRLAYEAVLWRDYPVIQGVVLVVSITILLGNLLVDLLYAYLDPRIRYT
jgi:peptide/nickel transport system permease protein